MKVTEKELEAELETCVAHIARRCGMFQDDVWKAMNEISKKKIDGTENLRTVQSSTAA
jgi:hypothetical protein